MSFTSSAEIFSQPSDFTMYTVSHVKVIENKTKGKITPFVPSFVAKKDILTIVDAPGHGVPMCGVVNGPLAQGDCFFIRHVVPVTMAKNPAAQNLAESIKSKSTLGKLFFFSPTRSPGCHKQKLLLSQLRSTASCQKPSNASRHCRRSATRVPDNPTQTPQKKKNSHKEFAHQN
jgi:hypothetical protein